MRNNLFTFAPWLPLLFHHTDWDQAEESFCPSLGSGPALAQGHSALAPLLSGTTFRCLSVQPPRLPVSEDVSKHTFSTWPPLVGTSVPNGLLLLRNSFNDCVFEHRSGCCASEPGYAGDIGGIEIWLIDCLILVFDSWLVVIIKIVLLKIHCPSGRSNIWVFHFS